MKNLKVYKKMLLIVDMENGFVKCGPLHDKKIAEVIPRQIDLIEEYKEKDELIVFFRDEHKIDSVEHERFGGVLHCIEGTIESEIVDELKPYTKDALVFPKNSTSFMYANGFEKTLDDLENLERVDVTGCCTDLCIINGVLPMMNKFDQENRKIKVYLHEDAIDTFDSPMHSREKYSDMAYHLMEQQGAIKVKKLGGNK